MPELSPLEAIPIVGGLIGRLKGRGAAVPAACPDAGQIEHWLTDRLATHLELPTAEIDPREQFAAYGLDSVTAVRMCGELERWLGRKLPPTLMWDRPSIVEVAAWLVDESSLAGSVA